MTGIEAGAGKIAGAVVTSAAKAVGGAIEEDAKEAERLLKIAEKSGQLDKAALIRAKRSVVKQHIRLKLTQPLGRILGVPREYFNTQFDDDMAERLVDVPADDLVTPRSSVAGPALLGLGFTLDEPELKAMYLNLIAAASDRRVQDSAHPSFAEIIKQLSASEAEALAITLKTGQLPIVKLLLNSEPPPGAAEQGPAGRLLLPRFGQSPHGFTVLHSNVLDWYTDGKQVAAPFRAMHIDNWIRLRLVTVDYTTWFTDAAYSWVETTPLMVEARERYDTDDNKRVVFQKGILKATDFGKGFESVVISAEAQKALAPAKAPDPEA